MRGNKLRSGECMTQRLEETGRLWAINSVQEKNYSDWQRAVQFKCNSCSFACGYLSH